MVLNIGWEDYRKALRCKHPGMAHALLTLGSSLEMGGRARKRFVTARALENTAHGPGPAFKKQSMHQVRSRVWTPNNRALSSHRREHTFHEMNTPTPLSDCRQEQ